MKCVNCGTELSENLSFCTNCGTPVAVTDAAQAPKPEELGSSLASAVAANQGVMDEIESHKELSDQAAARWAEAEAEAANDAQSFDPPAQAAYQPPSNGQPEAPAGYQPPSYGQPDSAAAGAAAAAAGVPFYQQDVSANAHYSSQRSYEDSPYGHDTGQPDYRQPSYSQGAEAQQPQQVWAPQPITNRAYMMVLYVSGLIGLIFALVVRDKDDPFITHHLNNNAVLVIGFLISAFLSAVFIGVILGIYLLVMWVMGIVSAYNGDMKELPLIGKIHIIK